MLITKAKHQENKEEGQTNIYDIHLGQFDFFFFFSVICLVGIEQSNPSMEDLKLVIFNKET